MALTKVSRGLLSTGIVDNSNATAITIDSSENVGIGTSSPSAKLTLNDAGQQVGIDFKEAGTTRAHIEYDGAIPALELGTNGAANVVLKTSNTERVRIDNSGNLLVGKSSNAYNTAGAAFGATGSSNFTRDGNPPVGMNRLSSDGSILNFAKDGAAVGSIGTFSGDLTIGDDDVGLRFDTGTGLIPWDLGANSTGGAATNGAIDIGAASARFKDLYLSGLSTASNYRSTGGSAGAPGLVTTDSTLNVLASDTTTYGYGVSTNNSGGLDIMANQVGQPIRFWCGTTNTAATVQERMRIDSSGNLLVGTTTADGVKGLSIKPSTYATSLVFNTAATSNFLMYFRYYGTNVGTISTTNTATTYSTSSDYRLKENIADADDAGSKIDAIQVRKYDWKADGSHQDYGMIAQELQTVAPEAVSGDADSEEMMGVDYSKLVPMLIKEIQSLRNRVAQLETGE